eukprot:TRINITY_DN27052_c0_g2_i1.p1 TRINITY_DN27052_c0_g2~~TRINITY_DN27052_c0_g2_i1.p1  ORF type:complete len:612 (+),score=145.73 TRINITY_DN27052_c0_g2_i1:140-1975(+)
MIQHAGWAERGVPPLLFALSPLCRRDLAPFRAPRCTLQSLLGLCGVMAKSKKNAARLAAAAATPKTPGSLGQAGAADATEKQQLQKQQPAEAAPQPQAQRSGGKTETAVEAGGDAGAQESRQASSATTSGSSAAPWSSNRSFKRRNLYGNGRRQVRGAHRDSYDDYGQTGSYHQQQFGWDSELQWQWQLLPVPAPWSMDGSPMIDLQKMILLPPDGQFYHGESSQGGHKSQHQNNHSWDKQQEYLLAQQYGMEMHSALASEEQLDLVSNGCLRQAVSLHQDVLLRNVPNALCTRPMMEAIFQQAGFEDAVANFQPQPHPKSRLGEVLLTMTSVFMADLCVRHFRGCTWDPEGLPVEACFSGRRGSRAAAEGMPEDVESLVSGLSAAAGELTQRVLDVLLEPSEPSSGAGQGRSRKARPMPPGLDSSHYAPAAPKKYAAIGIKEYESAGKLGLPAPAAAIAAAAASAAGARGAVASSSRDAATSSEAAAKSVAEAASDARASGSSSSGGSTGSYSSSSAAAVSSDGLSNEDAQSSRSSSASDAASTVPTVPTAAETQSTASGGESTGAATPVSAAAEAATKVPWENMATESSTEAGGTTEADSDRSSEGATE